MTDTSETLFWALLSPLFCKGNRLVRGVAFFSLLLVIPLLGCKGCESSIVEKSSGKLVVSPNPIVYGNVLAGESKSVVVTLENEDPTDLFIYKVEAKDTQGVDIPEFSISGIPSGEFKIDSSDSKTLTLTFAPTDTTFVENARLVITSSDPSYSAEKPLEVPIITVQNKAKMVVEPDPLRFGKAALGAEVVKEIYIRNVGTNDLVLTSIPRIENANDFKVVASNFGDLPATQAKFPLTLKPYSKGKEELILKISYSPLGEGGDDGLLQIYHRDVARSTVETTPVRVVATVGGPCIFVHPLIRDMGQVPIGTSKKDFVKIENCGSEPLTIEKISLTQNSPDDEFELDGWNLPLTLPPNQTTTGSVSYTPVQEGIDAGQLTIDSNDSFQPQLLVDLLARGSNGQCPEVQLGGYVEGDSPVPAANVATSPLKYVILDGSASNDPDGRIVEWEWEVVSAPEGGSHFFEPLASDASNSDLSRRRYRPLVAGTYEIKLTVVDNEGFAGCSPKFVKIEAVPAKKIHIELTWTNPADPDETDALGSDVDLHMVKMGPGEWFRKPYDIYFQNKTTFWDPEQPTLDIDDRDGGGPENIQLDNPVACGWYAVGIDYYAVRYGTAFATVRIYINQKRVFEIPNLPLKKKGNFYDVARIHWDGTVGTVLSVEEFHENRPVGLKPRVTEDMKVKNNASPPVPRYCLYEGDKDLY